MSPSNVLVLGTHNGKKLRELAGLLADHHFDLKTLSDLPGALEVEESGSTFSENAALKATQQARHLTRWVLAEDSGLSVDALDGAPGVHSARFSGTSATDASNNQLLLERLQGVPRDRRMAHYVCHVTLADPLGEIRAECEARCCGVIGCRPAGHAGFGYDPLFRVPEYHRSFGELGDAVKAVLSHRGRALRQIAPQLVRLVASGQWNRAT